MPPPLARERRITRSGEYRRIYDGGEKVVGRYLVCFYTAPAEGPTRVGLTVSGKVGNAVERNRVKRRLREAIGQELVKSDPGVLMVYVAKKRILDATFDDILRDIEKILAKVGK